MARDDQRLTPTIGTAVAPGAGSASGSMPVASISSTGSRFDAPWGGKSGSGAPEHLQVGVSGPEAVVGETVDRGCSCGRRFAVAFVDLDQPRTLRVGMKQR